MRAVDLQKEERYSESLVCYQEGISQLIVIGKDEPGTGYYTYPYIPHI